jgi:hypothetical protein
MSGSTGAGDRPRPGLVPLATYLDDADRADPRVDRVVDAVADLTASPPVVVRVLRDGDTEACAPTEVLLVRDVLDAPAYDPTRRRTVRVSHVWLAHDDEDRAVVAGVDLHPQSTWRRLLPGRGWSDLPLELVALADVHLASRQGHAAQLAAAGSVVHRLEDRDLAGLLGGLPVQMAAEVVDRLGDDRATRATRLLHPHVAERLAHARGLVAGPGRRRMRRTAGWRLNRPPGRG